MTIFEVFTTLRARWRFALLILATVVGVTALVSFLRTPQFSATASVVLDVKSPDPIAGAVLPGMMAVGYMATQVNVIQSERVAVRAIQKLKIDGDPTLRQQWQDTTGGAGDFKSWVSDVMLRNMDVVPLRDSNVITVTFTSPSAEFSALVANAWVESYIGTTLDLRVDPAKQYNSFFDARGKQLREELEKAQARLSAYQQANGIVASDERLDVENQRLIELTSQLVALQGIASESNSRLAQSVGTNSDRMQEVINNPLLMGLTSDLSRQEARLQELTSRYGDNYPQVVELRASTADLKKRVADETARVKASINVSNDINLERIKKLNGAIEQQRSKLLELKHQKDEASVLQRDIENTKRAYDEMLGRASQTNVESQATQTNVSILKMATPPATPSAPRVVLNIAASIFAGGLLAIGGALLREARDRRLRSAGDVLKGLRQPLLGVLPLASRSKNRSTTKRPLLTSRRRGAALPRPANRT